MFPFYQSALVAILLVLSSTVNAATTKKQTTTSSTPSAAAVKSSSTPVAKSSSSAAVPSSSSTLVASSVKAAVPSISSVLVAPSAPLAASSSSASSPTSRSVAAGTPITAASSSTSSSSSTTIRTSTRVLPVPSPSKTSVPDGYIRGCNIGGWLIVEPWMNQAVMNIPGLSIPDQKTFDQQMTASVDLQAHWSTYFTQGDVAGLAAFGMNALRIPIGFWAFDNTGTPFQSGAQYWLDQAIGWARQYNMQILLDVHGSPGSQNGWDHSGDTSQVAWQSASNMSSLGKNMQQTIDILLNVTAKYGSLDYADVIMGIEIVNEPINWGPNNFQITKTWAATAYNAMMAVATNPNLQIITHDSFMGQQNWWDLGSAINGNLPAGSPNFALDLHLYQNMVPSDSSLNVIQHIQQACAWGNAAPNALLPYYVGEFSAATNVCVNPDGTSFGNDGSVSCTVPGCQCTDTVSIDQWSQALKDTTRMFWEAQLQSFEHNAAGYFLWSLHGYGAWSLVDLFNYGIVGPTIDDRMYGYQCNYTV